MASLLVALPSYDGRRCNARAMSEILSVSNLDILCRERMSSLLAHGFNETWAEALNAQPDFFMLLHDDIIPLEDSWMQVLFEEFTNTNASILSVVSPIKSDAGLTSTAVESDDPWNPRRYTMTEIMEKPETWTEPGLLVNTGLMLVRFTEEWVRRLCFHIDNRIVEQDGRYTAQCAPEDWNFSREAAALGARIFATRKIAIQHVGRAGYGNFDIWGTEKTDPVHVKELVA
jgi:hypothetical protein